MQFPITIEKESSKEKNQPQHHLLPLPPQPFHAMQHLQWTRRFPNRPELNLIEIKIRIITK